jgi:hypothetical protein
MVDSSSFKWRKQAWREIRGAWGEALRTVHGQTYGQKSRFKKISMEVLLRI